MYFQLNWKKKKNNRVDLTGKGREIPVRLQSQAQELEQEPENLVKDIFTNKTKSIYCNCKSRKFLMYCD